MARKSSNGGSEMTIQSAAEAVRLAFSTFDDPETAPASDVKATAESLAHKHGFEGGITMRIIYETKRRLRNDAGRPLTREKVLKHVNGNVSPLALARRANDPSRAVWENMRSGFTIDELKRAKSFVSDIGSAERAKNLIEGVEELEAV